LNPNKKSVSRANSSIGSRPISASKKHDPTQVQNAVVILDDSKTKSMGNLLLPQVLKNGPNRLNSSVSVSGKNNIAKT
jgi:hypothetical protein